MDRSGRPAEILELAPSRSGRSIGLVVFDFDGTLSWLRHGWPAIMTGLFEERLPFNDDEPDADARRALSAIVLGMNGEPTLRQMRRFADLVAARGAPPPDPDDLMAEYARRLDAVIGAREDAIRSGRATPDEFVVAGARVFLGQLRRAGVPLAVVGTTFQPRLRAEAELLGLTGYFEAGLHGSGDDPAQFRKLDVFRRLLDERGLDGSRLLAFGDGPAEISAAKALGGLAVAVCTEEDRRESGLVDAAKLAHLRAAGADAAMADFRAAPALWTRLASP